MQNPTPVACGVRVLDVAYVACIRILCVSIENLIARAHVRWPACTKTLPLLMWLTAMGNPAGPPTNA